MKSIKILRILKTFEIMIKLTDLSRIPKKNKGLLICGKQFGIYSYNIKCFHQLIHHLTVHLVYVKYIHWFFYEYFGTNLAQSNFLIQTVKKVIHNLSVMEGETTFKRFSNKLHLYNEIEKRHTHINYFINVRKISKKINKKKFKPIPTS